MIQWIQQGGATVGAIALRDGRPARVVLMGERAHPRGAAVVVAAHESDDVQTVPLDTMLDDLSPEDIVQALCMQEHLFGTSGLDDPRLL